MLPRCVYHQNIFSVGFQEYDEGLALIHLDDAERLFQTDGPSGIRLKLDDMFPYRPDIL